MKKGQPARTDLEKARDRALIAELHLQSFGQAAIAQKLNMTRSTVRDDIYYLQREWNAGAIEALDKQRHREIAKLDRLERLLNEGYERSKQARKKVKQSTKGSNGGRDNLGGAGATETSVETQDSMGDSKHISLILHVMDRRARLLGLDAPTRQEVSGPQGGPIQIEDVSLTPEAEANQEALLREHYATPRHD